jgi:FKBP-type peptidyl-prolyl cis-trans isomerase FklB
LAASAFALLLANILSSDPNGAEAGADFLEKNKSAEGVVTLQSGLQYKVLEEGGGLEHPTVSTPCECHYAGRLLDGNEFDSSYKRGQPTTFAPNQVIKGWTEAMQLMVVGDKWEMYIPYELAYGAAGKPPKIPAKACLIFVMEIVKIKGATTPKEVVFPEWSAEELKLWTDKDESACVSWRDARLKKWEGGDAKLKESYPTREGLDAWLDKQCASSKNKSLWKRTRAAKKKVKSGGGGGSSGEAGGGAATLTATTARSLLDKALAVFREKANRTELEALIKECEANDDGSGMMKMIKLMPAVQKLLGPTLEEYGFKEDELMTVAASLMGFGATDPTIADDTGKLMRAAQGDLSAFV